MNPKDVRPLGIGKMAGPLKSPLWCMTDFAYTPWIYQPQERVKQMAAKPGTVTFQGKTYNVSTSFAYASFYECTFRDEPEPMIRFHRTEQSAQRGTWDSPEMKKGWKHVGWTEVQR